MKLSTIAAACILAGSLGFGALADAQAAPADFYHGKTFTIIIGSAPGGGYDTYARLIARHIGAHIPGSPMIVVQNMPGASSGVAANYMYHLAAKDGLSMAGVTPGALMEPLLGTKHKVQYVSADFNYVGSATDDVYVCVARKDAPVKKFADIFSKQLIVAAAAQGGSTSDFPVFLRNILGAKFRVINGYPGNAEGLAAVERGEVQGVCGNSYAGLLHLKPAWFRPDGIAHVIVQESLEGDPALNKAGVPLAISFAKTNEQRRIMSLLYRELQFSRPYLMAPGTAPERVRAIQQAFAATMRDPDFLADAKRLNLAIHNPLNGEELRKKILDAYATPPDIIEQARRALND